MDVRFVAPDLRRLDSLRNEALAVGIFADERPARGALGLLDWRLAGALSKLLLSGRLKGVRGERLMYPARSRLPFDKLLIFGLGPLQDFALPAFDEALSDMLATLARVRVRTPALALPGRTNHLVEPEDAMERFLAMASGDEDDLYDEITLIEDYEAQKVMAPLMERAKRRARADAAPP